MGSSVGPSPRAVVAVVGATGRQGSAVCRHLVQDRWRVRALTRNPSSAAAHALADQGAQIQRADSEDIGSLRRAFHGVHGVFNVQNPMTSSVEAEVRQGSHVAEAAAEAGVSHVVYGAAGVGGEATGVGSWDSKLAVAARFRDHGLRVTVLRPMAFMELMTDTTFYPSVGVWYLMPKLMGSTRPMGWLCTDDLGAIAARVFADPDRWGDTTLGLVADVQSIDACRALWAEVRGRPPRGFPMPVWLFERFVGPDLTRMWRWLASHDVGADVTQTRSIRPDAATIEEFVRRRT